MAGLNPNIRLVDPVEDEPHDDGTDITIDLADFDPDTGNGLKVENPDGSVTLSLDGKPINPPEDEDGTPPEWFDNLADDIEEMELSRITETLLRGIEDDITSRTDWIEDRAEGMKLLGLKISIPNISSTADGAPVEGMSKVRHPLLLEAVLRFQANARAELLPTDGPVKVRDDSNNSGQKLDDLAAALEKDMNHYLTTVATEYYPDTDRMLLMTGFGGAGFKKVYFCPLRNRPVAESIDAEDLIVNNAATDLDNAKRITHRIMMRPSTVKRMQIMGAYRDIVLQQPNEEKLDAAKEMRNDQQGIANSPTNPEDRDREIYECYCELDIKGFEHKWKNKPSGLEVPYCVTIDLSSRQVLAVTRNFDEPKDNELPIAKKRFVKYPFVPGLGFYDIGLLHILGNTTNAVTAAWRELLDAGMFAAFPGFLIADMGSKQNTNIMRVPPGGGQVVKTNGMSISDAVMPLPYKEPSPALMQMAKDVAEYGQRVGGTAEIAVGEGKQDAPVGTTLAIIDQATKVLNSVHKRLHSAQSEEFRLLVDCFRDHPEAFWQRNRHPSFAWDEVTFRQALENYYLAPQADPNTASHTQRMMKTVALIQLAQTAPALYNIEAVNKQALRTIGYDPTEFIKVDDGSMDPETMKMMAEMKVKQQDSDAKMMTAQADAQLKGAQVQKTAKETMEGQPGQQNDPADLLQAQAAIMDAENDRADLAIKKQEVAVDNKDVTIDGQNRAAERQSREDLELMKMSEAERQRQHDQEMHRADMQKLAAQNAAKVAAQAAKPAPKPPGGKKKKPNPGLAG
jgi:hypothetical protein